MLNQPIARVMDTRKLLTAPPETTVSRAARLMARKNVGAVMVVNEGVLIGIFTERDTVFRVVAKGLNVDTTRIGDVMTREVHTADPGKSFGYALLMMHEHGFRHVPVIENGKPVGMVSARSTLDPDLEEFVCETQRRKFAHRIL